MRPLFLSVLMLSLTGLVTPVLAHKVPDGARIYFIEPQDGDVVSNPVTFRFGVDNFGIAAVGVNKHRAGHHHLLIDSDSLPLESTIPFDESTIHYSRGEQQAEVELPPGTHTLQLLLGDEEHESFFPPLASKKITITVTPTE